jgi:serine phosphatase RsbU (regulator of sigma subunit)
MLSFRLSLGFACTAAVVSVGMDLYRGRPATALLVDLAVVALIGALALVVNVLLERQGRDLAQARDVAEAAQLAVLPQPATQVGPLAVAADYVPARAEARIGGDLYAVQDTPFGVRMIIGDVRGKGLEAVASVSVAIGAFRQEAEYAPDLTSLAQRLDDALAKYAERNPRAGISTEDFTTAVLVQFSPDGSSLSLVNRGHPPPYLVHEGRLTLLEPDAEQLPLGMGLQEIVQPPGPDTPLTDAVPFPAGALLLLITDGVTEARNHEGVFYDPSLSGLVGRRFDNPQELISALTTDVHRWTAGRQQDDMAILATSLRRKMP